MAKIIQINILFQNLDYCINCIIKVFLIKIFVNNNVKFIETNGILKKQNNLNPLKAI